MTTETGSVHVTIPTFKTPPEMLRRAVRSVLGQTHHDLRLTVISDGETSREAAESLRSITDTRMTIIRHQANRGRYACDHHYLTSLDEPGVLWAPLDSDDWAEPDWLERLLAIQLSTDADVVFCDQTIHRPRSEHVEAVRRWDGTARLVWHAHLSGLWSVDFLMRWKLTNPNWRIAWDSIMTSVPWVIGHVEVCPVPLVHRTIRPNSLTTAHTTRFGSPARLAARKRFEEIWSEIVAYPDRTSEILTMPELPAALTIRDLEPGNWALPKETLAELDAYLWRTRPMHIVEFGSGRSTLIFAQYARVTGATVTTFEHDPTYLRRTVELLGELRDHVDVVLAPLTGDPPMYDAPMPDLFDFALIDGPPEGTGGRAATFPALMGIDHGTDAEVWLDDGSRRDEAAAAQDWVGRYEGWKSSLHDLPHGLICLGQHVGVPDVDASGVTITMLTGARPELFTDTWNHLPRSLLATADRLVVLVNGADIDSLAFVEEYVEPDAQRHGLDLVKLTTPKILPIGKAFALFVPYVESPFWLHLEDDWRYVTTYDGWLADAKAVLREELDVAQVRLRHSSETVLKVNQVTRQPLRWSGHRCGMWSADAHLTNNPMLARTEQWAFLWPCTGETTMQRKARDAGLRKVVQLHPGAFVHTGDSDSLRERTGG